MSTEASTTARAPRRTPQTMTGPTKPFKMTKFQQSVLDKLTLLGATKKSPLRRNGAEFTACMRMYEAGLVGQNYKGFWPITRNH